MSITKTEVNIVAWISLSENIRDELADMNKVPVRGGAVFVKYPRNIQELTEYVNWAEFCRAEDIKHGEQVLVTNLVH